MTVRLIASDLDGTLLRTDHTISERTRKAIAAAHEAGITVVAATGRGWRSAVKLLDVVPEVQVAVCSNGALIRDVRGEVTTDVFPIADGAAAAVVDSARDVLPGAGLAWELADGTFGFDEIWDEMRPSGTAWRPERIAQTPPADQEEIIKVLVRHPQLGEDAMLQVLQPVVPDGVALTSSGYGLAEVTAQDVHKAHALTTLCDRLGISPAEVVALGDNRNDVEMLRWAGRGVAMGNALPAAVAAADDQTADHMDDGVAVVIEEVLADL